MSAYAWLSLNNPVDMQSSYLKEAYRYIYIDFSLNISTHKSVCILLYKLFPQ